MGTRTPGKDCWGGVVRTMGDNSLDARVAAWWDSVLAGEYDDPHPIYGDRIKVRVIDGRLELAGHLDQDQDRKELLRQARDRAGRGFRTVEASRLKVDEQLERSGLLEQTLLAAFDDKETAELARKFVLERSRVAPIDQNVVGRGEAARLGKLVPREFVPDVQKMLDKGHALLILRVDETDAFKVRGILEEDARSTWTIATPPRVAQPS
jgi:hypothetical protein